MAGIKFQLRKNYIASRDPRFVQIASKKRYKYQPGHCQLTFAEISIHHYLGEQKVSSCLSTEPHLSS